MDTLIGERALSRLKWGCRRGLLENDLFIARFFERYESSLNQRQALALQRLLDLPDNELLDLLLRRTEPGSGLQGPDVNEVLAMLRRPAMDDSARGTKP